MKNLRIRRKEKGHTCESLGNLVCVGKSTMAKYERGDIQPSKDILIKMAQILDCTTDYLLGLANEPTPQNKKDLPEQPTIEEIIANDTELSEESKQDLLKQLDMLKMRDNLKKYNKDGSSELQLKLN